MMSKNSSLKGNDRASACTGKTLSSTPASRFPAVLRGTEPQIGGPDLNAEFAVEEDRGCGASAAKVEYPHSRSQIERGREPLGHPEWIRGPADAGKEPFRVVLRRAGKSL